ncbi:MAG: asparaginase [Pseudomonadota bacterium]|nr:asparaginase [Pseudomonadota bacterium]
MQSDSPRVVVLGTGGTIAGTSALASDHVGYTAAQLGAAQLVAGLAEDRGIAIEVEQTAQIDSKDMDHAVWRILALAVERHLARPEVTAVVVTHGTDTLEETAYFLQRVLAPRKPVVLVGAMRPASAVLADGPQNLLDALSVAHEPGAQGVVAVLAGRVHGAFDIRKIHPYRLEAFGSGDAGVLADIEQGRVRRHRDWPRGDPIGTRCLAERVADWPVVEIVTSHAGADARTVRALRQAGVQGLVVAATGNGSVHDALESALLEAQSAGVAVLRASRTLGGCIVDSGVPKLRSAGALTPAQARVELLLELLQRAL